ncbi:MAG: carbohydrate ABC transporter permease [Parvibaculaceae bacterium]
MSSRLRRMADYFWLSLACLFAFFPVLFMLVTSFKTRAMLYEPTHLLFEPVLSNYRTALMQYGLGNYLRDSLIVCIVNVLICIVLGTISGYALNRFAFRHRNLIAISILSSRIFPSIALVIPFYLIGVFVRMLDTYTIVIVVFLTFNLPFAVVMMRSFFAGISTETEEAAMMDGCGRLGALLHVVLPQVKSGLFATAIMCFLTAWNEFTYVLFLTSSKVHMISTAVVFFKTEQGILWGEVSALGIVAVLPVILLCFLTQRYLVRGMV